MMKKYDAYKDSGVEWIGEVPKHWEIKKLKYLAAINPSKSVFYREREEDEEVIFLPMEKVLENGQFIQDQRKPIREVKSGFTYFERDDIIIAKITPCFENGKIALLEQLSTNFGFGSTEFHVLRAKDRIQKVYLYYLLQSHIFKTLGEAFMVGAAGQKRVPTDFVTEFIIALPLFSEQTAIAASLDRTTAEIDALIADKKRLIELLEEEKAAIINQAVTKGLDPDAPMKDSGVEWLGEAPEGWEVKRLKYLVSKIGSGITPTGGSAVYQTQGVPFLRSQNIHFDGLKLDDVAYISEEIDQLMKNSRILENDVLLNITGASIGRCFYVPEGFGSGNVNQHVCIIRPIQEKIKTVYLFFLLRSSLGQTQIDLLQSGANREGLNFEQLKNFFFPIPQTVDEQLLIAQHIETETAHIGTRKAKVQQLIDLLTEYRTALISEVVTGKIKVTE